MYLIQLLERYYFNIVKLNIINNNLRINITIMRGNNNIAHQSKKFLSKDSKLVVKTIIYIPYPNENEISLYKFRVKFIF